MAAWRDVRRFALALPGTSEERTARGWRAWIVDKKFFTWERPLLKSDLAALGDEAPDGPILGVRTAGLEMKDVPALRRLPSGTDTARKDCCERIEGRDY
jgi:hypothetical protein